MQIKGTLTWPSMLILLLGGIVVLFYFLKSDTSVLTTSKAQSVETSTAIVPETETPTATNTQTPTLTPTPTETQTPTATLIPTETPTFTPTPDDPNTSEGVFKHVAETPVIIPSFGKYLIIDKLEINSTLTAREIIDQKTMETPYSPEEISVYDFSFLEGLEDQVILAGHVDYANYGPAIFANLKDLVPGDTVQILNEGEVSNFVVVRNSVIDMPFAVDGIVRETEHFEGLTLITCAGEFTPENHYNQRQIVQAIRID